MYKQVETHKEAILNNGVIFHPVATLESEFGGVCHISVDDHCYKITLLKKDGRCYPTHYIFPDVFKVLKTLPELSNP